MSLIVAGGGPAGAVAAALVARAGRSVTLLERTTGPTEKICGEFVSGEAVDVLRRAGLDVAALGGHAIGAVRLLRGGRCATAALPFAALGVSRGRLDEALLRLAAGCGAELRRGCAVARAETHRDGATLILSDGARLRADALFLATGKHDLRGMRREAAAEDLVGFKMHYALGAAQTAALCGHVEVTVFADAYVGLQRIEDGRANLCLLARRAWLQRCGGTFDALLDAMQRDSGQLRQRLRGAVRLLDRPLSIARVPYGFLHRPDPADIAFRLGDQAAVIPSFAGDGMAIALHSAALASAMFLAGADAASFHRRLRREVAGPVRRAWALYRLGASPGGQAAMIRAASSWPGALRLAARLTRVPPRAVARLVSA